MPQIGKCKLCLRPGVELQESHFLPKGAYRAVRKLGGVTPILIRHGTAIQMDEQMKDFVLCAACEVRLNKNGEDWVLRHCNRRGKGFKLSDLVHPMTPQISGPDLKMYPTSQIPGIDAEKLRYFAISVLWRGSAHAWSWGGQPMETPSLGRKYQEEFRRYLMGETDFPMNAVVTIHLQTDPKLCEGCCTPTGRRSSRGDWVYSFYFLGLYFVCSIGNLLSPETRNSCVSKFIFQGPIADMALTRSTAKTIINAKRLGSIRSK